MVDLDRGAYACPTCPSVWSAVTEGGYPYHCVHGIALVVLWSVRLYLNMTSRAAAFQYFLGRFAWYRAARVAAMTVPINRSANEFCCGECGIVG